MCLVYHHKGGRKRRKYVLDHGIPLSANMILNELMLCGENFGKYQCREGRQGLETEHLGSSLTWQLPLLLLWLWTSHLICLGHRFPTCKMRSVRLSLLPVLQGTGREFCKLYPTILTPGTRNRSDCCESRCRKRWREDSLCDKFKDMTSDTSGWLWLGLKHAHNRAPWSLQYEAGFLGPFQVSGTFSYCS